jgi:hypothetical protein
MLRVCGVVTPIPFCSTSSMTSPPSDPLSTIVVPPNAKASTIHPSSFYASTPFSNHSRRRTPPPNPESKSTSTPISNKISGSRPYSSTVPNQDDENRRRLASETSGHFIGGVPIRYFLNNFLPLASDIGEVPDTKGAFAKVANQKIEKAMYTLFVCVMTA